MTVGALRKILEDLPDSTPVVLYTGEKGKSLSPLSAVWENCRYKDGEFGLDHLTPALKKNGYGKKDLMKVGKRVFVLWP